MPSLATTGPLTLRLFGPFHARIGDVPLPRLRSRKGEWLLALLALRGESGAKRDWLAGTLWPESEESLALYYLRRELSVLRQALGPEASRLISGPGGRLRLDLTGARCDVREFDAAVRGTDPSALEAAVSLYAGTLLEGCSEEWVVPERASREAACLSALERLATTASAQGDCSAAVRHLRSVVTIDPLRECAQRELMKALAECGDGAAVVEVYRDLRLHLHRELNAEADPETAALYARIREHARSRKPVPPIPRPPDGAIWRIPIPLTPLIGRTEERREVRRRLESVRLLTLLGTGGVGKTRLSVEVAGELREEYAGGVCFVELATVANSALVPQVVADALGLKQQPGRTAVETLIERLRGAEMLLVLDNCEHVLQACAELAGALLSGCARLRLLATSREALGVAGESVWRVPSLSVPPRGEAANGNPASRVAEAHGYEAFTLFVERAEQANPSFLVTPENLETVAGVCRRLDGIPLAIELAAARVRALTIADIDRRLDQRFHLLTGGSRAALPRHQTLRALIDWSHDLLSPPERALLARLSVFSGGWTLDAAAAVCAGGLVEERDVVDLLTALVDKNLVIAETSGATVRYHFLETIREYARERLLDGGGLDGGIEGGGVETWSQRHLAHFVALAEQATPHLLGPAQQTWLHQLDAEHDNIRAALAACLIGSDQAADGGLRLCGSFWRFWLFRSHLAEGRRWCTALLERGTPLRTEARAGCLSGAGVLAGMQGEYDVAVAHQEEALGIWRERKKPPRVAASLQSLGNIALDRCDWGRARALYQEALGIQQELGDRVCAAGLLHNLGLVAKVNGDHPAARSYFEEALTIYRETDYHFGVAIVLGNLGVVVSAEGDHETARAMVEESLDIRRELGNRRGIAASLSALGAIAEARGEPVAARGHFREALGILRDLGDRKGIAETMEGLAVVSGEADVTEAVLLWGATDRLREELGSPRCPEEQPQCDAALAAARAALGDSGFQRAWAAGRRRTLEEAIALALGETVS